jgi:hypothetical protein
LTIALLLSTGRFAHAQLPVTDINNYDGSSAPLVWVTATGQTTPIEIYADAQSATDANWQSNGSPIPLYCTDTLHSNPAGASYYVNVETTPYFSTTPGYGLTVAAAANLVAWAMESAGNSVTDRGATQLFVWSVTDENFSVTNWNNNTSLENAYNTLVSEAASATGDYVSGAVFLGAVHVGDLYQDLAYAEPGVSVGSIAPEPSSFLMAGLGALGMVAYGWRRRTMTP